MPSQFPTQLDDQASLHTAVNNFATALTSPINATQTVISVASINTLPEPGIVSIDTEVIFYESLAVVGASQQLIGCTRGADGTVASAHANGARVEARWVAEHHNVLMSAIIAIQHALGVNPQGSFLDVAQRLAQATPEVIPFATPTTNWSFTHDRRRLVSVQLYRRTGTNTYELFDANIEQVVDANGMSTVTIELPEADEGAVVFQ